MCPQDCMIPSHQARQNPYRQWLANVIEIAVEKALQLDGQHCHEESAHSRKWALPHICEERHLVTAKIHSLLLQWRPDFSLEWNMKVRQALPILETVFYQQAKSREDYINPLLLELQLRRVLSHFEAGNGPLLLQRKSPIHPLTAYYSLHHVNCCCCSAEEGEKASNCRFCLYDELDDERFDDSLEWGRANLPSNGTVATLMSAELRSSRKEEANRALWNAIISTEEGLLEENLYRHGEFASKRIVKRVMEMLKKKKKKKAESQPVKKYEEKHAATAEKNPCAKATSKMGRNAGKVLLGMFCSIACHGSASEDSIPDDFDSFSSVSETSEMSSSCCMVCMHTVHPHTAESHAERGGEMQVEGPSCSSITISSALSKATADDGGGNDGGGGHQHHFIDDHVSPNNGIHRGSLDHGNNGRRPVACSSNNDDGINARILTYSPSEKDDINGRPLAFCHNVDDHVIDRPLSCCNENDVHIHARPLACSPNGDGNINSKQLACNYHDDGYVSSKPLACSHEDDGDINGRPLACSHDGVGDINGRSLACSHDGVGDINGRPLAGSHNDDDSILGRLLACSSTNPLEGEERAHSKSMAMVDATFMSSRHVTTQENGEAQAGTDMEGGVLEAPQRDEERQEEGGGSEGRRARVPLSSFLAQREDWSLHSSWGGGACPWDTWEELSEALDPMCCVCMVGLKGAAFTSCGHTFCRKCSRELWKNRGTCPLCNKSITGILDIY